MAVCADYRIPHSEFLGWDPYDRQKAIWWMVRENSRCGGCGTRPDEWDEDKGGHRQAYTVGHRMCPGCFALEAERDRHKNTSGVQLTLRPRTRSGEEADPGGSHPQR